MRDVNTLSLPDFAGAVAADGLVRRLFELARDEDLGVDGFAACGLRADVTSAVFLPPGITARAEIVVRQAGALAGLAFGRALLETFGVDAEFIALADDGERVAADGPQSVAFLRGTLGSILVLERTLLNLIGRLSGVATLTARYVERVAGVGPGVRAGVYDTRKTTPGLRLLEKYAVRCGGGRSHRLGLHDALLIKDNHIALVPPEHLPEFIRRAVESARRINPDLRFTEVEVDTLDQLGLILAAGGCGVDIVLLDNMSPETLAEAVRRRNASGVAVELEASGGVNLGTIADIARSGVDRVSVGALTHQAVSLDVGLDISTE